MSIVPNLPQEDTKYVSASPSPHEYQPVKCPVYSDPLVVCSSPHSICTAYLSNEELVISPTNWQPPNSPSMSIDSLSGEDSAQPPNSPSMSIDSLSGEDSAQPSNSPSMSIDSLSGEGSAQTSNSRMSIDSLNGEDSAQPSNSPSMSMDSLSGEDSALNSIQSPPNSRIHVEEKNPDSDINLAKDPLPFPSFSCEFYMHQGQSMLKNLSRENSRKENKVQTDDSGKLVFVNRSSLKGSIETNIEELKKKKKVAQKDHQKKHLQAVIEVGQHMLNCGPMVSTQDAGAVYSTHKQLTKKRTSSEYYGIFSKYLNLVQLYINGKAYLIPNTGSNIEKFITTVLSTINIDAIVNGRVLERLEPVFKNAYDYMDTPRDKLILKGLMAQLTSANFTTKLLGIKSRQGATAAKVKLESHLSSFSTIRKTSQIVRSDLTVDQQHRLTARLISKRKQSEIKVISPGRGRKLKSDEFPDLANVLLYAFERESTLEAHPRLTTGTLYRTSDSATTMEQAREIILANAPKGFSISLSTCYNYTENYREGSAQARRHHAGRGVNAPLSFKMPSRTGVDNLVINLHWSTANVKHIVDNSEDDNSSLTISKDAKAIVIGGQAVQRPGRTWKKAEHPDHSWDQSRTNAVTPMTFLFLESKTEELTISSNEPVKNVEITRGGQGVTLLYLSFFEADTTFRCLNEIFMLLSLPELDNFFRDTSNGNLKKEIVFVVDNGPAEQPSCLIVQMCMVRLLKILKLKKIKQVSFAEYHSKRNYVERVHAAENDALAAAGVFRPDELHKNAAVGSAEHEANIEHMAEKVRKAISKAKYGRNLICHRGIKNSDYIFNDEKKLKHFLSLSEENKLLYTEQYKVSNNTLMDDLSTTWGLDCDFSSSYIDDYLLIKNELKDFRTCWKDKYTSVLYSPDDIPSLVRYEIQPVPDYLRWLHSKSCELHYMPTQERNNLEKGPWDDIPGAFLPTKILDLLYTIFPAPSEELKKLFSVLAWLPLQETKDYITYLQEQDSSKLKIDGEREVWSQHPLYKQFTKIKLTEMCKQLHIPVKPVTNKLEMVKLISKNKGEAEPSRVGSLYSGRLDSVPSTTTAINKISVGKLRAILSYHKLPTCGCKDQLVLRVFLLRQGRSKDVTLREEKQVEDLIHLYQQLSLAQRRQKYTTHVYSKRKYSALLKEDISSLMVPSHIREEGHLHSLFQPILNAIHKQRELRHTQRIIISPTSNAYNNLDDTEAFKVIGTRAKIKWTVDEIGDSGWSPGWYVAIVQGYDTEDDILTVIYPSEPGYTYENELTPLINNKKIKLVKAAL